MAINVTSLVPVGFRVHQPHFTLCLNHPGTHNAFSSEDQDDTLPLPLHSKQEVATGLGHWTS